MNTAAIPLLIALIATNAFGFERATQPQTSSGSQSRSEISPRRAQSPYQRQDTWYEFMLKQFNPDNINYGRLIEQRRQEFLASRVKNPYFLYGLCCTLALLVVTTVCVKLEIDHRREMWVTAEMMADLYNQDSYSRQVAQVAIERYNRHIERCNRAIEAGENGLAAVGGGNETEQLRAELMRVAEERDAAIRDRDVARDDLRRKSEILAEMSIRLGTLTNKTGTSAAKVSSDLRGADAKLVTHINNLQEQLYAERKSNRSLKGA